VYFSNSSETLLTQLTNTRHSWIHPGSEFIYAPALLIARVVAISVRQAQKQGKRFPEKVNSSYDDDSFKG